MRRPQDRGFTLVELLVVIGIIALLISILLPSLSAARRQANAVKCATQLRELGNAFRFYAGDNKNFYPPALMNGGTPAAPVYEIDGITYPQTLVGGTRTYGAYWFNFINKYVSKTVLGSGGTTSSQNAADARKTVVWGCAAFDGYTTTGLGTNVDVNPVQPGYGFNFVPYFTPESAYPAAPAAEPYKWQAWNPAADAPTVAKGVGFHKATFWNRQSALRMLLCDSALYLSDAAKPKVDANGNGIVAVHSGDQNVSHDAAGSYASLWRHGKLPTGATLSSAGNRAWYPTGSGGKVAFNVLYCDGHVNLENNPSVAYSSQRMRFPG